MQLILYIDILLSINIYWYLFIYTITQFVSITSQFLRMLIVGGVKMGLIGGDRGVGWFILPC